MALARADLGAAVAGEQRDVLALAGLMGTDTAGHLKEPLDRCFRALGTAESGLADAAAPDGAEQRAIAFANYFALDRAAGALAIRVDVSIGRNEANAKESQAFAHVRDLVKAALEAAQSYGLRLGAGQSSVVPIPYAGGLSRADYEAVATDQDRVPPLFSSADPPAGHERFAPAWGEAGDPAW